jgi:phosphoribosylamine---glycine ligase
MARSQRSSRSSRPSRAPIPDKLHVLLVGGGGREHALADALKRSPSCASLWTTHPNNPGIKAIARPMDAPFSMKELYRTKQFIEREGINLVVVGPEQPLADGIVDGLSSDTVAVFGPNREAAQIESDKAFSKQLLRSASIPTAEAVVCTSMNEAMRYLEAREEPPVVKAAGLAAGKGVFVPETLDEARDAVRAIIEDKRFGDAGNVVILEERLKGPEVSVFALVDGRNILTLDACQDHKRLRDGNEGPNTGGMGAFCPSPLLKGVELARIERDVIVATVDALRREGIDYRGVLYAGLMLTHGGPKVLEFNARFGDPEAQVLMQRMKGDLARVCYATAAGALEQLTDNDLSVAANASVCVVLAAPGYPEKPITGGVITGVEEAEAVQGVKVYHAGTAREEGELKVAGGRVLNVVASGQDLAEARVRAYDAVQRITFRGMQLRTDIAVGV